MNEPESNKLLQALDKSIETAGKLARQRVEPLRYKHPDLSDEQLLKKVDTTFTSAVTTTGAATGAMAAAPGVGTSAGLVAAAVDTSWFLGTAQGHSDYPRFSDNGIPRIINYNIAIRRGEATAHATPPDSVPY